MTTPPPDAMAAARGLTDALNTMSGRLQQVAESSEERDAALAEYGRTNRRLIRGLTISVILDIILTVAIGVVGVQAHNNTAALKKTAASNLALCEAGNVARHQQIQLWEFVIQLPPAHKPTAQQRKNVAAFEAHLRNIFGPRRCTTLGEKH